ncbi:hypothetical protein AALO_G00224830 [Alosa alosa]|uniref:Uncharacterized protein n=1 Tax=Alosa alosa TaxID=278164 RepID=A0AAV6FYS6_9TELE|nr:hypothetical protein AALO_G00224830 [Alosa alosa]
MRTMVRTPPETVEKVKVRHFFLACSWNIFGSCNCKAFMWQCKCEAQDRSVIKVSFIKVLQNVRTRHHLHKAVCCVCVGREEIIAAIDQNYTIGLLRACNLKALVYLNEGSEKLIKEYLDAD